MAKKTITALFDSYERATEAVRRLEDMGVSHSDISIVANNADNRYSTGTSTTTSSARADDVADDAGDGAGTGATLGTVLGGGAGLLAGLGMLAIPGLGPVVAAGWLVTTLVGAGAGAAAGGLLGSLVGAGVSEADAQVYEEGVRRGGTLVTVRADDAQVDRVVDILDDHGSVDIDERSRSWRSEGWTGSTTDTTAAGSTYAGSSALGAAAGLGSTGTSSDTTRATTDTTHRTDYDRAGTTGTGAATSGMGSTATDFDRARSTKEGEEAIPIVEEDLNVGKRQVEHGRVRVHSHVVETPVQEEVTLREEEVRVERRPVDRPLTGTEATFQDRTIEAVERDEEAVVSKDARVKEELVIKKDVEQRTETVSDTVRRTEVEVDDDRSRTTGTPTDRKI
jgi:uncharacterized protein (TIGR02271 family)